MPSSSPLVGPTRMLVAVAALMLQVVMHDRLAEPLIEWAHLLLAVAASLLLSRIQQNQNEQRSSLLGAFGVLSLFGLPFVADVVQRSVSSRGCPFEIQLVLGLRNMMFALAATRDNNRALTFAALASCFTALYSILWLMNSWNVALICVYTIVGMWWLAGSYWERINDCFLSRSERALPWKPVCGTAFVGFIVLVMLMPLASGTSYTTAIHGLLPSSGGTRWEDEYAWGGVGDGSQLVSAKEDASSFAPIESELFLESKMPSLYDCFNEFAEPPPKKNIKKKRMRAIPLASSQMKQNHQRRGTNQKPGREFSTVRERKRRQPAPKVDDLRSAELLQVVGRVPVHLGLYTYDLWDGHELRSSDTSKPISLYFEPGRSGKNWVRCAGLIEDPLLTHREQHELRIINLKTDRLPSPPSLIGAHIDQIHTETFFNTTKDGMLALDMEFIPQLSVIHVESLCRRLINRPFPVREGSPVVDQADPISTLAKKWTTGVSDGWPQVEAVCRRLRTNHELDPEAMVPPEVDDAVVYFLEKSRRGPDYLFAASTAVLLRSLGYEARVVSGFYARPQNYDRQARVTSVYADDAHFWVEVLAKSVEATDPTYANTRSHWIPIEPSPGYEVLLAPESFWSLLLTHSALTWEAITRNPMASLAFCAVCLLTWWRRAELSDFAITNWWRIHHRWGDGRHRVMSTLRLLERRARVRGRPRAKGASLGRWDLLAGAQSAPAAEWEMRFLELANWALYGNGLPSEHSFDEINSLCSEAATSFLAHHKRQRVVGRCLDKETT